jgi:hypothetical protein
MFILTAALHGLFRYCRYFFGKELGKSSWYQSKNALNILIAANNHVSSAPCCLFSLFSVVVVCSCMRVLVLSVFCCCLFMHASACSVCFLLLSVHACELSSTVLVQPVFCCCLFMHVG